MQTPRVLNGEKRPISLHQWDQSPINETYYTCWVDCRIEPRAIVLPIPPPNTSSPGDRVSFTITISPAYQLFWLAMCFLLLLLSTCQCLHIFQLFLIFLSFCLNKKICDEFSFTLLMQRYSYQWACMSFHQENIKQLIRKSSLQLSVYSSIPNTKTKYKFYK